MKVVKQKHTNDCALACIAMASGKDYDKIFSKKLIKTIEKEGGAYSVTLEQAYGAAGYEKDVSYSVVYTGGTNVGTVREFIWKRKALLQVDSLNQEGKMHLIYWDGEKIIDPSNLQVYNFIKNIGRIYYVTLF